MKKTLSFLIFTVTIIGFIAVISWLFYDLDRSSASLYRNAESALSTLQEKRHALIEMSNAVRSRSTILLKMLHEEDYFKRDKMSQSFSNHASAFIHNRNKYRSFTKSEAEEKLFSQVMSMVSKTAKGLRRASALLIDGGDDGTGDELARQVLFSEVFPAQNELIISFTQIQQILATKSELEITKLNGQVATNRQKLFYLALLLAVITVVAIGFVRSRFKEKETLLAASEAKFRSLYDNAPDMYLSISPQDECITLCNETLLEKTGYALDDLCNKPVTMLCHTNSVQIIKKVFEQYIEAGSVRDTEIVLVMKNGNLIDVSINIDAVRDANGKIISWLSSLRDISERKRAEYILKQQRLAMDCHSLVSITNVKGNITYTNKKFCDISGYTKDELIGQNHRLLNSGNQEKNYWQDMYQTIASGEIWQGEIRNKNKEGCYYWVDTTIVPFIGHNGKPESYVSIRTDITAKKMVAEKISYQASHDALTGLINRREFEKRLQQLMSHSINNEHHALLYLDLDQFKVINDTCGHHAGDELLRQIPQLLACSTRRSDLIARLGGDEFAIILSSCQLDRAEQVARSVLEAIANYRFSWEKQIFKIGVSIGIVEISDTDTDLHEVLKHADSACYEAKEGGRNRFCIYTENDQAFKTRSEQMDWVSRINTALRDDLFVLYAQAIVPVNPDSSSKPGYELLIRMLENGKIIPPFAFIPAAERYNLMIEIDRWVINKAISIIQNAPDFSDRIDHIAINLSGQSLADKDFIQFMVDKLDKSQLHEKICLEITETAAIGNITNARRCIEILHGMGMRFALDDFGSGLSSFSYLKTLDVDYLKIDGTFVKNIANDPIDRAMVKSIHEVATVMGKKTVAEFVEDDAILAVLKKIGVDYAQGYGIEKPKPLTEILGKPLLIHKIQNTPVQKSKNTKFQM